MSFPYANTCLTRTALIDVGGQTHSDIGGPLTMVHLWPAVSSKFHLEFQMHSKAPPCPLSDHGPPLFMALPNATILSSPDCLVQISSYFVHVVLDK